LLAPERKVPVQDAEVESPGRLLLARCERIIARLGEDGVKPLSPSEFKKVRNELGYGTPEMRESAMRPLVIGPNILNWTDLDEIKLEMLREMLPREDAVISSYLETLANMGATSIERTIFVQAAWDHAFIERIADEALIERFLATRLKAFDDYLSRKIYAFSLGLMGFRRR
jgi:hypothetical protein